MLDVYMVMVNPGRPVFVKTYDFFKERGGFREAWGSVWVPVVASSIEDAGKKGSKILDHHIDSDRSFLRVAGGDVGGEPMKQDYYTITTPDGWLVRVPAGKSVKVVKEPRVTHGQHVSAPLGTTRRDGDCNFCDEARDQEVFCVQLVRGSGLRVRFCRRCAAELKELL